mmetsp:Transcript_32467/g.89555  ORF Transcript_32467/g.89555 Transcript_32467/m.89555 type:complete len:239 (-) Transcript_32467:271-987(-)
MEGHPVHVLRCGRVRCDHIRPADDMVLVVVVNEDQHVGMGSAHLRPQVLTQEVSLLHGRHHASLPVGVELWLVLDGDGPEVDAPRLVGRDPARDVVGPRLVDIVAQAGAQGVVHAPAGLHPRRRAPRRGQEPQALALRVDAVLCAEDQGNQRPGVTGNRVVKMPELEVIVHSVERVVLGREVAAVDVHATDSVTEAILAEIGIDHLVLLFDWQLGEDNCARLRESTAKADYGLPELLP